MNDTEFITLTEHIFNLIEDQLEAANLDIDILRQGNILDISFDNGQSIVINRNQAIQELWIAAQNNGYHFTYQDNTWISTREKQEFFSVLSQQIHDICGESVLFSK